MLFDPGAPPLFILEMANNHMGDVEHGLQVINALAEVIAAYPYRFGMKFQYRDLDTFIHPDYQHRDDNKYVRRFRETRLSEAAFLRLKAAAEEASFLPVCTPFDEPSVDRVVEHGYHILKVASCSFTDWPLLERIAETDLPIVASTAGATSKDIDRVVSFFEHREKKLCLMHCVGSYPTRDADLELNQIDFFRRKYPEIAVGFSTHEDPDNTNAIMLALAKGAVVFERHVGLPTETYNLNAYSSTPDQIRRWLDAAGEAIRMCGTVDARRPISEREAADLRGLKRAVYSARAYAPGARLTPDGLRLCIPAQEGQLLASDLGKYHEWTCRDAIEAGATITFGAVDGMDRRGMVAGIITRLAELLRESKIPLSNKLELELSHHYGIETFDRWGCSIITCVNREYCKKLILLLPGQENPVHAHSRKEETFHVLHGTLTVELDGVAREVKTGEMVVVERGVKHRFSSRGGTVVEEISTTHYVQDSAYDDPAIMENRHRKTALTFWRDWIDKPIV